ncbi:MAG: ABC transporter permease [Flavobacteriales bacterium]|nr:ABC transporter permease [Flavobacteriales bacterium]
MSRRLFVESFIQAWQALVTNRLRTLLSLLGVMIGIFMITAVFAVSDSLEENLKGIFSSVRSDVLFVEKMPWTFSSGYPWWKYAVRRDPTLEDAEMLADRLPSARTVAFQTGSMTTIEKGSSSFAGARMGAVTLEYLDVMELDIAEGRFFSPREVQAGVPVVLIGREIADRLFPNGNALDQTCTVEGRTARIIGVLAEEGTSIVGSGSDDLALIPVTFGQQLVNFSGVKTSILIRALEGVDLEVLKGELIAAYRPLRRLHPREDNDFAVNEVEMLTAFIDVIFGQVEYGVWFIGVFAILIGCFSVANIMFVSVKERTPLIGVQKALGAKRSFVLAQFLTEAVALCIIGALLALFAVGLLVVSVNLLSDGMSLVFGPERFLLGLGIAVVSGVISGLAPALQAARMDPVEAMRAA